MKTASSDLFLIIHSLSAPEKAYIIRTLRKNSSDSHYLKLFALINKQPEFDENSLLKKAKHFLPKKKFIHVKNRMSEVVLSKLENYHSSSSVNSILQSYLKRAEIFQYKNQVGIALKFLLKAKRLAIEQEKFEYYLLINAMIVLGYRITSDGEKLRAHLTDTLTEREEITKKIEHNEIYKKLVIDVDLLGMKSESLISNSKNSKELISIINSPYLKRFEQTQTISAALNFLYVRTKVAKLLKQNKKALLYQNQWLTYLNTHLTHWEKYDEQYLTTLSNICGLESDPEKRLRLYIQAKKIFHSLPSKNRYNLFPSIISNFANLVGNISATKAVELFSEIKHDVEKYSSSDVVRLVLYLNMSINYFILSNLHSALKCLNHIIQYKGEHRMDAQVLGRIYFLIYHYEQKNYDLLPYLINSYQKWISKHCPMYEIELETLLYFKKTPLIVNDKKKQKDFFTQLKNDLEKISEQNSSLINKDDFFLFWLDSKIEDEPFLEIMKKKKKRNIK